MSREDILDGIEINHKIVDLNIGDLIGDGGAATELYEIGCFDCQFTSAGIIKVEASGKVMFNGDGSAGRNDSIDAIVVDVRSKLIDDFSTSQGQLLQDLP